MTYYDEIASSYDELHKEEQLRKLSRIAHNNFIFSQDRVLDVGCGTGFSLDYFAVKYAVGIDPSPQLIEQYEGSQDILVGCAEKLPFCDRSFDVVISVTALQSFSDVKKGCQEIKRVGKNRFCISTLKDSPRLSLFKEIIAEVFEGYSISQEEGDIDIFFFIQAFTS